MAKKCPNCKSKDVGYDAWDDIGKIYKCYNCYNHFRVKLDKYGFTIK